MEIVTALTTGGLAAVGMWLLLDRNLVRVVIGIAILGNAINLGVLTAGRLASDGAAFVGGGGAAGQLANPLPQALVLTAIVIGFGIFVFALAVLRRIRDSHGITTTDVVSAVTEQTSPDGPDGESAGTTRPPEPGP